MRTTLEIPDELFTRTKLKAVQEGVPLKVVIARALQRELDTPTFDGAARQKRAQQLFAALDKARNNKPVGPLNREELYDRTNLRGH